MLKRWLLRFLAGLLTAFLCVAIVTSVLSQTVLNSQYVEGRIRAINGYNRLSTDISSEVAQQTGLSDIPQAATVLRSIISPGALRQRVNGALDGLQSYYQGKGSAPTINLSGLATQAQAAGVPIGQDSDLFQPVTLGPQSSGTAHPALNLRATRTVAILTSVLLAVVLGILSWKWRRYGTLPNVLISTGLAMSLIAAVAYFGPGELGSYIKLSSGSSAFAALARDLVQNIARDLAHRFALIAAVCLVLGVATRILAARFKTKLAENALLSSSKRSVSLR